MNSDQTSSPIDSDNTIKRIIGKSRPKRSIFLPLYYELHEQAGKQYGYGYQSNIYKSRDYAIKIIDVSECSRQQATKLLQKANDGCIHIHQNIVRNYEVIVQQGQIIKVMEWCQTDLRGYLLNSPNRKLEQREAICMFRQIIKGCSYLRKQGSYHQSLKPQNILLQDSTVFKGKKIVKLTNFDSGWKDKETKLKKYENNKIFMSAKDSISQKSISSQFMATSNRTMAYMPPEYLQFQKQSQISQIWSLGVILYEIIFGERPWKGDDKKQILFNIKNIELSFPMESSLQVKILLIQMLKLKPEERIQWRILNKAIQDLPCQKIYYKKIRNINSEHQIALKQSFNPINKRAEHLSKEKSSHKQVKSYKLLNVSKITNIRQKKLSFRY